MTALWLPGAERKPIQRGANDPFIIPVGDVFHVAVSEARSLYEIFTDGRGIESTGYIRRDGSVEEYRPFNVECDAQLEGNSWVHAGRRYGLCSWETQGGEFGDWTPEQVATIKRIIAFRCKNNGVHPRICPTATSSGFGIHNQFRGWNPNHHTCPGPDRTRQWNSVIVPWIKAGASQGDEFDMASIDDLRKVIQEEVGKAQIVVDTKGPGAKDDVVWNLNHVLRALLNDESRIRSTIRNQSKSIQDTITAEIEKRVSASGALPLSKQDIQDAVESGLRVVLGSLDK